MVEVEFSIEGKGCPYALLYVQKKLNTLNSGDVLKVRCDHCPAAMENIPYAMEKEGHKFERVLLDSGLWLLTITKK